MLFSLILGLALFAVTCYLVVLFFQVHRVEKKISDLIQMVEIHLLNRYGHNPNRNVQYVDVKKVMSEEE
jgi:flagellar biogenesis protein FliO